MHANLQPRRRVRFPARKQQQALEFGEHDPMVTGPCSPATGAYYGRAVLSRMLVAGQVRGLQVHDARVAALCRQHGVRELWSADRDFSRFHELRVRNPLLA